MTLALFHTLAQQRLRPTEIAAVSEPHDTDADRTGIELTFSGLERLVWSAAVSGGAAVNLQPVARGNPDPADDLEGSVTASARIARGLTIDATFLGRRVSEPASAASILQNHIWRLKATYQFTPELGIRTIVQRETLTTNAALTTLWPYTDATTDVLVTYMTAPGRALFIGASRYNDRRTPQPSSRGWQLFAKLSYAFQL